MSRDFYLIFPAADPSRYGILHVRPPLTFLRLHTRLPQRALPPFAASQYQCYPVPSFDIHFNVRNLVLKVFFLPRPPPLRIYFSEKALVLIFIVPLDLSTPHEYRRFSWLIDPAPFSP